MRKRYLAALVSLIGVVLLLSSCGSDSRDSGNGAYPPVPEDGGTIRLVYPEWSSEIASAYLFQALLQERGGYRVELQAVGAEEMWRSVAQGEADLLCGAWLPATHRDYRSTYGGAITDLGPNLEGARTGLAVPREAPGRQTDASGTGGRPLVEIGSLEELKEHAPRFGGRIAGIDPEAGIMARSRDALEAYGLASLYRLNVADEEAMLKQVARAVQNREWIVFTAWRPHWIFEIYNLRFLDDPRAVFGGEEAIHTMVRSGFIEDFPRAVKIIDRISYSLEDLERLMRWIREDESQDPYGQAVRWIEEHPERVEQWITGGETP